MKTGFLTALVIAASLVAGGPAFAHNDHKGGAKADGHGARSGAIHSSGGRSFASARGKGGRSFAAVSGKTHAGSTRGINSNAIATTTRRNVQSRPTVAFGGSSYNYGGRANRGGHWTGDRSRDYGNDWTYPYFGIYPYVGNGYPEYGSDYYGPNHATGNSLGAQVQQDLADQGYYQGPIDGIVGPATQAAIVAYQQANGLPVSGVIDTPLLRSLGI